MAQRPDPHFHTPTGPGPAKPKRPWFKKKRFVVPGALVVLAGIGGAISGDEPTAEPSTVAVTTPAVASESPSAAPEESPFAEPEPAATTEKGDTPETTTLEDTPHAEETTPEPDPEPTVDPYAVRYGTFDVVEKSGSGDSIVAVPEGITAALVTATHTGSRNFVIKSLDANNEMSDLLVNEIGPYSGTVDFGVTGWSDAPSTLQITADGPWTVTLSPVGSAPAPGTDLSGKGDRVLRYEGDAGIATVNHVGESNFVIHFTDGTSPDLLVNEIGAYSGMIPIKSGPALIAVKADGDWTITVT